MTVIVHSLTPDKSAFVSSSVDDIKRIQKKCKHCQAPFSLVANQSNQSVNDKLDRHESASSDFCCRGCESAHRMILGLGLETFYDMYAAALIGRTQQPLTRHAVDYSLYDSADFQSSFVRLCRADALASHQPAEGQIETPSNKAADLMIDGVTCYACVWLIQNGLEKRFKSASSVHTVISISINQTTGITEVKFNESLVKLSAVVEFIESLGYRVSPSRMGALQGDNSEMIKVGVGLFIMLNVMSFAVAEYFAGTEGLSPSLQALLRWLSFSMTLCAMLWPGREFFVNSWRALRYRSPSIDAPIAGGLMAAFAWSTKSTISGYGDVYYDSITAIIAFVMTGRLIQRNVIRRNQSKIAALLNPNDGWTLVQQDEIPGATWVPKKANSVKKGERLRILPGEMLLLRGICSSECATISFEQLKGEAGWRQATRGETLPAGIVNGDTPVEVIADQDGVESYTESLARSIERVVNEKGRYHLWSDRAAWALFTVVVLAATGVAVLVAPADPRAAVSRIVAMMLVACPCTFAIGVPLVFGTAMRRSLEDGILFKSQRALEALSGVKHLVFDKTGTLTEGDVRVKQLEWESHVADDVKSRLLGRLAVLDQISSHHVPKALAAYCRELGFRCDILPDAVSEKSSAGMIVRFEEEKILIGSVKFMKDNLDNFSQENFASAVTLVSVSGQVVARVTMSDVVRPRAKELIDFLKISGRKVDLLSGDSSLKTLLVARELSLELSEAHGEATPSSKLLFIRKASQHHAVAMIGNGLNDTGAMAQADISIAVDSSSTSAMKCADVCLLRSDISLVELAMKYASAVRSRIRLSFVVATIYNLFGLYLAARGMVSPVVAAILMPISSLTITYLSTSWSVLKSPV